MQKFIPLGLISMLLLSPSLEAAQRSSPAVDYSYFSASIGGGDLDSDVLVDRDSVTVSRFNLQWVLSELYVVNLEYKARFTHFDEQNDRADYLIVSAGRRFALCESLDLEAGIRLGGSKLKLRNQNGSTLLSEKDFILGGYGALNYGLSQDIALKASLEYLDYDVTHEASFELSADYYLFDNLAFGVYGRTTWNNDLNLNQGGVIAKLRW
ncbi:hypothetical protein [Vibrio gallicus]|uniref:hypothetical protein n=1 Tax=Vibrio gallicus TaxID=190897 RepID=UPI0021C35CDE|nr:hypothetical protein [Vibrio gallicus]